MNILYDALGNYIKIQVNLKIKILVKNFDFKFIRINVKLMISLN